MAKEFGSEVRAGRRVERGGHCLSKRVASRLDETKTVWHPVGI